jgi:hypothetical protein
MTKMFKMVGQKYTYEYTKQPMWFLEHEWSEEEEEKFHEWLINFLLKTKGKDITRFEVYSRKHATRAANEIVANYGWKLKVSNE